MSEIRGVITALATAFRPDGELDIDSTRKLAAYLVENGSHGLVVAGSTGESSTLEDDEKIDLTKAVVEEVGPEVTVIVGSGSNDTRHSVELTKMAAEAGADAALIVTPYYVRPNRAGIRRHFEAVAEGSPGFPIVAYNIPSRTGINMPPEFLAELAQIDEVKAVKQANDDDLGPIEGLDVLAGNDGTFLPTLKFGGAGGILVASHLDNGRMRTIWDLWQEGRHDEAEALDNQLQPLYEAMGVVVNPIPVKAALAARGLLPPTMRLPLVEPTDQERDAVEELLAEAGVPAA
ncbi:MAG TPA: 4-hydroxy-tetrahydrodipicolinate synthase [Solirubrobacterales bacterium]|nr:4-hydroxy-tetrahydrodipicolinate synthase [Solirubrobacterales bacterium]HNC93425.1 4-hydroxy-tetrahydrodipicolinate synthase [Solirubrobacterales bacterium]HNF84592.1 4-hydroxy-tetrahydrodipicolinate synthase [Solirubrobacterales bacterium]HNG57023.1 4-hydroxy-tetrahydrodipicolinate synthase [Solirubrobacterales bacterium]HNK33980.1 4-hydroxy-tetrahydrodipicolinate synthase [Solirubrobacterales bacterium]